MTKEEKATYDRARYVRRKAALASARAADPIEQLSAGDLAYLAGLIDGEGSIYVSAVGPQRKRTVYPIVCIAMTHRGVIDWVAETLSAPRVQLHNQTNLRRHAHLKPQWRVQLHGQRAQLLCRALRPLLKVKHEQASLVADFPVDARSGPGVRITEEVNAVRYSIRDQVAALNHAT